jgi:tRNA nucleotidyltransferase (CCA-adding enzyme)
VSRAARWEHFPHGADIGVRGIGPTRDTAFEQAALALTAVVSDPASVRASTATRLRCDAPDLALLFVDWLNALVYEMATARCLFGRFDVTIRDEPAGFALDAVAHGEPLNRARHEPAVEVKGATHTELRVAQLADRHWVAQCVVDV